MVAKTSEARRRAFIAAVEETGNQTLAAERAKVSRVWVQLRRTDDPAFRAALDAAIASAKARLDAANTVTPKRTWCAQGGEELIVRGSNGRWTQVACARMRQWTPRTGARFLAVLSQTCNVKEACRAVGLSQASAYEHRRRWREFGDRWASAITFGYDTLSMALAASARAMLGDDSVVPDPQLGPITVDQAIQALWLHRARVCGVGRPPGHYPKVRDDGEITRVVLRKIEVLKRAKAAKAAAADRRATRAAMKVRPSDDD